MKKNILLLSIIVVLGILFLVLPGKEEKQEKTKDAPVQLMSIREPELKKITIKSNLNKKEILLEKKSTGNYFILPQGKEAGNSEALDFIAKINSLEGFSLNVKIEEKENYQLIAELNNQTLQFSVYGMRPFGKPAYYVKTNKGLFVVEKEKIDAVVQVEENSLRNHILTDYTSKDILEFQINQKKFYQKEEGKWFIQGLKEEETDSNKIFGVFATISSLRIKSFTGHTNKSLYLLDNPLYTLVIKLKNGTSLKYFLSKVKDSYYCLPENGKEILEMNQYDWKYFGQDGKDFKKDKLDHINQGNLKEEETEEKEENDSE